MYKLYMCARVKGYRMCKSVYVYNICILLIFIHSSEIYKNVYMYNKIIYNILNKNMNNKYKMNNKY